MNISREAYASVPFDERMKKSETDFGVCPLKVHPELIRESFRANPGAFRNMLMGQRSLDNYNYFINRAQRKAVERLIFLKLYRSEDSRLILPSEPDYSDFLRDCRPLVARKIRKDDSQKISDFVFWFDGLRREYAANMLGRLTERMRFVHQTSNENSQIPMRLFIPLYQAIDIVNVLSREVEELRGECGAIVPVLIPYYANLTHDVKKHASEIWLKEIYGKS